MNQLQRVKLNNKGTQLNINQTKCQMSLYKFNES